MFGEKFGWERVNYFQPGKETRRMGEDQRQFGWNKPPFFERMGIEHAATRERVTLFDLTSFGKIEVKGKGGHSSRPVKDNVIYTLANGLQKLSQFDFPVSLNEVTKLYFERGANYESGATAAAMKAISANASDTKAAAPLANQPAYNATLRTTCVATMLEGGHAENALPQTARAKVNCRILPTESADAIRQTLVKVINDERISITPIREPKPSPPSPLRPDVMSAIERVTSEMWPGVAVVPTMSTGATDSLYLRKAGIAMYGTSGIFGDIDDSRAHGKDERVLVQSFFDGQEYLYRLAKAFTSSKQSASK